jgi:hypothetical protein
VVEQAAFVIPEIATISIRLSTTILPSVLVSISLSSVQVRAMAMALLVIQWVALFACE